MAFSHFAMHSGRHALKDTLRIHLGCKQIPDHISYWTEGSPVLGLVKAQENAGVADMRNVWFGGGVRVGWDLGCADEK